MSDRALSDDDVNQEIIKLRRYPVDEVNSILEDFSNCLTSLITTAIKHCCDEEDEIQLTAIRKIVVLLPLEEKFIRVKGKIWNIDVRKSIMKQDATYFMEKDYSKNIKKDDNQEFIENLIMTIKTRFQELSLDDQLTYWKISMKMLQSVARFKRLEENHK